MNGNDMAATVAALQLDACLHEVLGGGCSPALAERITGRLGAASRTPVPARRRPWLLAAMLLLGVGAVATVAMFARAERGGSAPAVQPATQEPAPQPAPTSRSPGAQDPSPGKYEPGTVRLRVLDFKGGPVQTFKASLKRVVGEEPGVPNPALPMIKGYAKVPAFADRDLAPRDFAGDFATLRDLPDGRYALQIAADFHARTVSQPFTIGREAPPDLTVRLTRGGQLTGRIVDPSGNPVTGAVISSDDLQGDSEFAQILQNMTPDIVTKTSARTDADGRYRLTMLAFATYRLRVEHPDFCNGAMQDLKVTDEKPVALPDLALVRGAIVEGTVTDGDQPVAGAKVTIGEAGAVQEGVRQGLPFSVSVLTDTRGNFRFERRLAPGTWTISAFRPDAANALATAMAVQQTRRELKIEAGQDKIVQDFTVPAK